MLKNKRLLFLAAIAFSVFNITAQNTNSPYSRYGYGVLTDKGIGAAKSMGGISYGMRGLNVNPGNPASYSGVDSLTFIFDIGVSFRKSYFEESGVRQSDDNGGLEYMVMMFPLSKRIGFSAGVIPYSFVGYRFGGITTANNITKTETYSGDGGLSQVYGGLSYQVMDNLSVGANISYLFGRMTHAGLVVFSETGASGTYFEKRLSINAAKFDIGVQYQMPVFDKKTLTIGAVYTPAIKPSARLKTTDMTIGIDTTTVSKGVDAKLPHTFGLGFAFKDNKRWVFGADVTFQKWENLPYPKEMIEIKDDEMSDSDRFNNRWRINTGAEYIISPTDRNFFKRIRFRGGLNYSNSYLNVYDKVSGNVGGYNQYGGTFGLGLPFRSSYTGRDTYINIGFEYTRNAPEFKTMVKEEYFGVSVGVNLNDLWFMKNKFR